MHARHLFAGSVLAGMLHAVSATAQQSNLDALVSRAMAASPTIRSSAARLDAARARVSPASALPDPMLMLGIINQPLGGSSSEGSMTGPPGPDPMTMRMVGVEQMLPFPGKLALRRRVATHEADAAEAMLEVARRQVGRDVRATYYELSFVDRALDIVARNQDVMASLVTVTEARYGVGATGQQDVLQARVEAARLCESASALMEQRRAALARLNALLDQPSESAIVATPMPDAITRAAVSSSPGEIRFVSTALGSRAADSPLRPLTELQDAALRRSPEVRAQDAMIAAQAARVELARKEVRPDIGLSVQYGQRGGGLPDMVSATVSIPIPVFRGRKQNQMVVEATSQVAALDAERVAATNAIRAEVARLVSDIERDRTRLALSVKAILPQSRAALASAIASYQAAKVEFLTVLENQATVFTYETEYFRALTDFATSLAELERVVGEEVTR